MNKINRKEFQQFIFDKYQPSAIENNLSITSKYTHGSNYASINWKRFYQILKYFQQSRPKKITRILDVGSYPGTLLRLIKDFLGIKFGLYSADLNNPEYFSYLEDLNINFSEVDLEPTYYTFNINFFDYSCNFFDYVFATDVIEHIVRPLNMLREIKRVLKPGGVLLLTTDNQTDIGNAFNLMRGRTINQDIKISHIYCNDLDTRRHIHTYTKHELEYILRDIGFNSVEIHYHNTQHSFRKFTFKKRIYFIIRNMFYVIPMYRPHLFVICKK